MLYKQQSFSNFEPDLRYLDSFPFSREEFLFFDIETTGFSPRNTSLYRNVPAVDLLRFPIL